MPARPTICLNMIVKNEAHVIRRCLESARPLIDRWLIVDTGSTDGTQDLIREILHDIPGELVERPWKNFGHNRSEAITLAGTASDYLLFIDADDLFVVDEGFTMPALEADAIDLLIEYGTLLYRRVAMVRSARQWRYVGVLHEYPDCDGPASHAALDGLRIRIAGGGARSQVDQSRKFLADAELLEQGLRDDPDNARYAFYLGQSYRDAGAFEQSLAAYQRRTTMAGFAEEVFCARLESARLLRLLGRDEAQVIAAFLAAHEERPSRAEPLGELAQHFRERGQRWHLAYLFADQARRLPVPGDLLFIERDWYEWRALDEYAIAAYWTGRPAESRQACETLLASAALPAAQRPRVQQNLDYALARLAETGG